MVPRRAIDLSDGADTDYYPSVGTFGRARAQPIRAFAGTFVSENVAEYEATPLVVVGVGETEASAAVRVVPGSALRETVADWPALILIASASAKAATTWTDFRSARSTKPELEVAVVLEVVLVAEPLT